MTRKKSKRKGLFIGLALFFVVLGIIVLSFFIYVGSYYKPTEHALSYLQDSEIVTVKEEDDYISFVPKEENQEKEFFAEITKAEIIGEDGTASCKYRTGEKVTLKIYYKADPSKLDGVLIWLAFYRSDNLNCYGTNTVRERIDYINLKEQGEITCEIDKLNFVKGSYRLDIAIRSKDMFAYDYKAKAVEFTVYSTIDEVGVAKLDHKWTFD